MAFPKLIIFDLDGTLIDSVPDLALAIDAMLTDLSLPVAGESKIRQWVGNGAAKLVERALEDAGADQGKHSQALSLFFQYYQQLCAVNTVLYEGVYDTLKFLVDRGVKLAIATNKPRRFVKPILQHLAIHQFFSVVVGGDDVPNKKPHPEQLIWCMRQLHASPEQTLMVGDSRNDIQAAQAASVAVIAVNYGYNHGQPIDAEGADKVIANFAQLVETARSDKYLTC